MSNATVELDFFGIEKNNAANYRPIDHRNSIRGIQSAISRMNPNLLRSVIACGSAASWTAGTPSPPPVTLPQALPVLNPASRSVSESPPGTAPLTIFFNGTVTVFDVPQDTAENIIKMAAEGIVGADSTAFRREEDLLSKLNGDLPIARKKSLLRFLEKRKERMTAMAPYASGMEVGSVKKKGVMGLTPALNV